MKGTFLFLPSGPWVEDKGWVEVSIRSSDSSSSIAQNDFIDQQKDGTIERQRKNMDHKRTNTKYNRSSPQMTQIMKIRNNN